MTMQIDFITWNACGLQKLARFPSVLARISSAHVILLQETLQVSQSFHFNGFTRFDVPAIETLGRASGGLTSIFSNSVFSSSSFEVLHAEPHLLLVEISAPNVPSMLFGNVYIPRFSGASPSIYSDIHEAIVAAIDSSNPSLCVIAGDWNAHLFSPSSPFDRAFVAFDTIMADLGRPPFIRLILFILSSNCSQD